MTKKTMSRKAFMTSMLVLLQGAVAIAFEQKGFMDVGYQYSPSENASQSQRDGGFLLGGLDYFVAHNITDQIDVLSEIVFEAPAGSMLVDVERIEIGYTFRDWLSFRAGRFHTPLGYYANIYHHGRVLDSTINRPLVLEFEDAGGLVPAHTVGLWARGNVRKIIPGTIKYNVAVANGLKIDADAQELAINMTTDDNKDKVVMGNLGYEFPCGLGFGGSVYSGKVNGYSAAGGTTAVVDVDQNIFGVDLYYDELPIQLIAEYYWLKNHDVLAQPSMDYTSTGFFIQGTYEFMERFRPYARYERVRPEQGDPYATNINVAEKIERTTYGLMIRISQITSVKLEGIAEVRGGRKIDIYGMQWAFQF